MALFAVGPLPTGDLPHLEAQSAGSTDRDDDFAALKTAALHELKGRRRRTAVVLPAEGGQGGVEVHDVGRLSHRAARSILDRVLSGGGAEPDNLDLLKAMRARLEAAGLSPPTITVRFRDLSVRATITVAHHALPSISGPLRGRLASAAHRRRHLLVDDASGVLRPGAFTLLLGPPQSGKTTLLRALAGLDRRTPGLKTSAGELTYNGLGLGEFVPERSAAYISQQDLHFGELTVRETLEFSARCQSTGHRRAVLEELEARESAAGVEPDPALAAYMRGAAMGGRRSLMVELVLRLLGLDGSADTVVGSAMLRGISGGQRKRVTTGEVVVGPARVLLADEISTGLDSSTTFAIMRALQNLSHVMHATMLVGLLQPAPEVFELFDDVMVLAVGKVVFHGPREAVVAHFSDLGLVVPQRCGVADFLQEVTTPSDQHKYWDEAGTGKPHRYVTPRTLRDAFRATDVWRATAAELDRPFPRTEETRGALATLKYGSPPRELLRAVASRTWILLRRSRTFAIIRTTQVALMAVVVATAFWREDKNTVDDGNFFLGCIFYSLLYQLLGGVSEMHLLCDRLPVFYKQRAFLFYPGWAFALPTFFLRVPYCFLESTLWAVLVYFAVGLDPSVRFLYFYGMLFLSNVWSTLLFQLVAAVCREDTIATAAGSFMLLIFINFSGFVIIPTSVPAWWQQGLWPNPFFWAYKGLAINEFTSSNWAHPNPANPSSTLGLDVLEFRGLPSDYFWRQVVLTPEALEEFELADRRTSLPPPRKAAAAPREGGEVDLEAGQIQAALIPVLALAGPERVEAPPGQAPLPAVPEGAEGEWPAGFASDGSSAAPRRILPASQRLPYTSQAAEEYRKRTTMPFIPLVMTFTNVQYSVPLPKDSDVDPDSLPAEGPHAGQLRLLKGIDGAFRPGVLAALMGASGAGKTTLLDVLAARKTEGTITGDIRVNGHPKNDKTFAHLAGYVEQTDIHLPQTSVREALAFSAALRLPTTVDAPRRAAFVGEVLSLAELDRIGGAFVGVPGVSGLSSADRKRLTLAVELVANPSILFMDEPTSGLDARAAGVVMRAVRNTVDSGRTVVCTIHQPNTDIFLAFDELLLLKPGGLAAYFGPLGNDANMLLAYLHAIPGVPRIRPNHNPANFMLEVASLSSEAALGLDLAAHYRDSPLAAAMRAAVARGAAPAPGAAPLEMAELHVASWGVQFRENLGRFWRQYCRAPEYNLTRALVTLGVAFVFGSLFWRQGDKVTTPGGVLNVTGLIFSSVLFIGITNCLTIQHLIATQRTVFYRERAAGYYAVLPYALAQQLVELPWLALQTIVYCSIVYWAAWLVPGGPNAGRFFLFCMFFYVTLTIFTILGVAAVNLTPNVAMANVFCSFLFGFFNLFSGFLLPYPSIPVWYQWVFWLNPVAWSIYALTISQLGWLSDTYITDFAGQVQTIPQFLAARFNFHYSMMWPCLAPMLGFVAFYSGLAVLALKKINYQRR